jgi:hypothetical protein
MVFEEIDSEIKDSFSLKTIEKELLNENNDYKRLF